MRTVVSIAAICLVTPSVFPGERQVRFNAAANFLPSMKAIVVVKSGEPGPGAEKHQMVVSIPRFGEAFKLPDEGPFDVYWQGSMGIPVRIISGMKVNEGEVKEVNIGELLGVVDVRGDNQPRTALITIASQDDPGPGEKGHRAIQTAKDFREAMAVPDGYYSLWVTPDNGARPRKINDRFRVQAGKTVQLD